MISRRRDKGDGSQQGCTVGLRRLICVVCGKEFSPILADSSRSVNDIAGDEEEVGFVEVGLERDRIFRSCTLAAVAEEHKSERLPLAFSCVPYRIEDWFAVLPYTIMKLLAGKEVRKARP